MADTFEVIYENKQSGVRERCTQSEWERIRAHKTLGRAFRKVKIEMLPQAAVEAQAASIEEEKETLPAPSKRGRKAKDKSTEEE